jgi:hypothetical protein
MTFSFPTTQMRVNITLLELCYSSHSEYSYISLWFLAIMNRETRVLLLYILTLVNTRRICTNRYKFCLENGGKIWICTPDALQPRAIKYAIILAWVSSHDLFTSRCGPPSLGNTVNGHRCYSTLTTHTTHHTPHTNYGTISLFHLICPFRDLISG